VTISPGRPAPEKRPRSDYLKELRDNPKFIERKGRDGFIPGHRKPTEEGTS
jgi:hypothetical protein